MELITIGREHYPNMEVPVFSNLNEEFSPDSNMRDRLRLVLIEEGTGILNINEIHLLLIAPTLLCLNETECPKLENHSSVRARSLYFHPCFINNLFNFENIRQAEKEFSITDIRDNHWLRPFLERNQTYHGQLAIGPAESQRVLRLMDTLDVQLNNQPDGYWPCRSRSYLLELLFFIERIFMDPTAEQSKLMTEIPDDVAEILLYLHHNYQRKITIAELAKLFHINRTTLNIRFQEIVGVPIVTYLIQLRMRLAALFLRDTNIPVSEIIERVGIQDAAHFSRLFRKYTNYSPTDYRQKFSWILR